MRQAISSGPRCSSSRRMRRGSLPLMNSDGAGVKPIFQPSGVSSVFVAAAAGGVAGASWPDSTALRRSLMACTAAGSAGVPCSASASRARSTSTEASMASTAGGLTARWPARSSSSSVSSTWVRPAMASKPNVADPPLIEWAARKIELIRSPSRLPCSSDSSPASIASSPSRLSSKNVAWKRCMSMFMATMPWCGRKGGGAGRKEDQPRTFWTVATSCSGLNGLTSQPVAPAALPSAFLSAADSVVSISMGVNL